MFQTKSMLKDNTGAHGLAHHKCRVQRQAGRSVWRAGAQACHQSLQAWLIKGCQSPRLCLVHHINTHAVHLRVCCNCTGVGAARVFNLKPLVVGKLFPLLKRRWHGEEGRVAATATFSASRLQNLKDAGLGCGLGVETTCRLVLLLLGRRRALSWPEVVICRSSPSPPWTPKRPSHVAYKQARD